jgi:thiol:disulfide interchange protein
MAGALGAALLMPPLPALLVMAGLGLGMALPFFILGFVPAARRWIPRPGQWMVTLRHLLGVPMFATALGLAWIVGRQGGVNAMATAMAAALILSLSLWWYGAQQRGGKRAVPALVLALSSLAIVGWGIVPEPVSAVGAVAETDVLHSQPFSATKLADPTAQHKPVFLYLTADWCLPCKVNEATSLSSAQVAKAFDGAGVTVMRGDWTRQDPAISAFLKEHGRAGVPLYLWYPANGAVQELPQVLTPATLTGLVGRS